MRTLVAVLLILLGGSALSGADFARWEPAIQKFEEADKAHPPQAGSILFVGSSTIVGWDTERWFPDMGVLNRGFGGSRLADVVHFFDRVVKPYEPRVVVLYAGDNDLASGSTPEQVVAEYEKFAALMREKLPEAKLVCIGVRPSVARVKLLEAQRTVNEAIHALCEKDEQAEFIDVFPVLLGEDGKPREDLLVADKLHLNEKGYEALTGLVTPFLKSDAPEKP